MKSAQGPLIALFEMDVAATGATASLQDRLFDRIRGAILSGALKPGNRLPSTRTLSLDLGLSRNTVVAAVERLVAEGYLEARIGSGTYVAARLPEDFLSAARPPASGTEATQPRRHGRRSERRTLDLRPGRPDPALVDLAPWRKALARRWRLAGPDSLVGDTDGGCLALRATVARHLLGTRGIACDPAQVMIVPGRAAGLRLATALLLEPGDTVWMEAPGCPDVRAALEACAARAVPVPVDAAGLDPEQGRRLAPDARLAVLAPSWQVPMGGVMPLRRRLALLAWAARAELFLLEDDADGAWRHAGRPLPAFMGLEDPPPGAEASAGTTRGLSSGGNRTLFLGGLERILAPAFHHSWLVVPPELAERAARLRSMLGLATPIPEQLALHDLIAEGHLDAHLRRARRAYTERQEALLAAARHSWSGWLELDPAEAGLHLVARFSGAGPGTTRLPDGLSPDVSLARAAAAEGIALTALSPLFPDGGGPAALALGYGTLPPEGLAEAVERIGKLLDRLDTAPLTRRRLATA